MKRYITRWALSKGIRYVEGRYVMPGDYFSAGPGIFVRANEAFETLEEAKAKTREMAAKQVKSLLAKAKKLSDPNWEPKVIES